MRRLGSIFFRSLYLLVAAVLMLIGLISMLAVVQSGTGFPLWLSAEVAGFGALLLWIGMVFRIRGSQWVLASQLLIGVGLAILFLATYPPQAYEASTLVTFSPTPAELWQMLAVLAASFFLVTLLSPRARRALRQALPKVWVHQSYTPRKRDVLRSWYLGAASALLLGGWIAKLYFHREPNHYDASMSVVELLDFHVALLGFVLFGCGLAFRLQLTRRVMVWTWLIGVMLSGIFLLISQRGVTDTTAAFAPTPEDVYKIVVYSAALLLVVLLAPVCRKVCRGGLRSVRRQVSSPAATALTQPKQ